MVAKRRAPQARRALHLAVCPVLSWFVATRRGSKRELVADDALSEGPWPCGRSRPKRLLPSFGASTWRGRLSATARGPKWVSAFVDLHWRWAGHLSPLFRPPRCLSAVLKRSNAPPPGDHSDGGLTDLPGRSAARNMQCGHRFRHCGRSEQRYQGVRRDAACAEARTCVERLDLSLIFSKHKTRYIQRHVMAQYFVHVSGIIPACRFVHLRPF